MILRRKNRWRLCLCLGAILLSFGLLLLHPFGSSAARHRFSPSRFAGVSAQIHSAPIIGQRQEGSGEAGLDTGQTLTRELAGGQARNYQIELRASEKENEAYARLLLGWTYVDLKEKEKAEEQYRAALQQWEASSNKQGQEITKQSLVNLSQRKAEPSAGDRAFTEAEALRKQGTAETYRQAIAKYEKAAALYRAEGNKAREALSLYIAGYLYSALGEKQKALEYYQQALPLYRAVSDRSGEANTLTGIGAVYSALGE